MAGRPLRRALIAAIEKRARAHFEDEDLPQDQRASHLDYIISWVQDGNTVLQLANEIKESTGLPISSQQLGRYIRDFPQGAERVQEARQQGAHSMVDQAIDIVDSAAPERDAVRKAQAQASVRTWVAERWNRKDLGAPKGPAVQISINTMHLDALRRRANAQAVIAAPTQAALTAGEEEASFEVEQ
jgi:hypothetical protein